MAERRYDFAPLERLVLVRLRSLSDTPARVGAKNIADELGEDANTITRARKNGLGRAAAERLAEAAGFVPYEVWPEILDEDITDGAETLRQCRGPFCGELFVPVHPGHRYCTPRCSARARQARRSEARRQANRGERECASPDCARRFVPPMKTGPVPLYCSDTCGHREHQRTYRRTQAGKEANRRAKRKYDAEVREIKRRRSASEVDGGHLERRRPAA